MTKARRQTATRGRATLLKGTEPTSQPGWAVPLQRQPHATDYQQAASGCIYHYDRRLQPGGLLWETTARRESSRKATRRGIHTKPGAAQLAGGRIEQQAELICCSASLPPLGKLEAPLARKVRVGAGRSRSITAHLRSQGVPKTSQMCSGPSAGDAPGASDSIAVICRCLF